MDTTTVNRTTADRLRAEQGSALVETAVAFLLFFTILWAVIAYGMVFAVSHGIDAAASEAARAAISSRTDADAIQVAMTTAEDQLGAFGAEVAGYAVIPTPVIGECPGGIGVQCITVTVEYPWAEHPVVPDLFGVVTPDVLRSTSTIQLTQ